MNVKNSKTPVSDAATIRAFAVLKSANTNDAVREAIKTVVSDLIKTCRELETQLADSTYNPPLDERPPRKTKP